MKKSFDNAMVAHVWAQQTQEEGYSPSMSFSGDTLYSYRTPIGRIMVGAAGERVVLVNSQKYSTTTSGKHLPALWKAIRHIENTFTVPQLGVSGGKEIGYTAAEMHKLNLQYYVDSYAEQLKRISRARSNVEHQVNALSSIAAEAWHYVNTFDLPPAHNEKWRTKNFPALDAELLESIKQKESAARTAKLAAARKKEAAQRAYIAEHIHAWRENISNYEMDIALRNVTKVYLKTRKDEVITSKGARFPADDARRAFPVILRCRKTKASWRRNGETVPLGYFQIDEITPAGDVKAGCHYVEYDEIEIAARALGLA